MRFSSTVDLVPDHRFHHADDVIRHRTSTDEPILDPDLDLAAIPDQTTKTHPDIRIWLTENIYLLCHCKTKKKQNTFMLQ